MRNTYKKMPQIPRATQQEFTRVFSCNSVILRKIVQSACVVRLSKQIS